MAEEPIRPVAESGDGMGRDLLSQVTGDGVRQRQQGGQDPRPPPSPTLRLRLVSAEERQSRAHATTRPRAVGHARRKAGAPTPAADDIVAPLATSSRAPFPPDRLASVVVPGYPMAERRRNLRAGAGARAQACQPTCAPHLPPTTALVPILQLAGPTVEAAGPSQQESCDACGLSAQLLRGLSSDLDRARAQVALLTCQNESLRSRLKRAAAAAEPADPAASPAHLDLRCRACRVRPAMVMLVPQHLCLCCHCSAACRDGAAAACPVCRAAVGTGPATNADADPR